MTETVEPAGDSPPAPEEAPRRRARFRWGVAALVVAAAAIGVLAYQNMGPVPVRAFWWEFEVSLVILILLTAVTTIFLETSISTILVLRRRLGRRRRKNVRG